MNFQPQMDEPLGSHTMFGLWCKGSNIKTSAPSNIANMYSPLENISDTDKRTPLTRSGGAANNKEPYSSKGSSLERNFNKRYNDGKSNCTLQTK